jgi:hypothetical protein
MNEQYRRQVDHGVADTPEGAICLRTMQTSLAGISQGHKYLPASKQF